MHALMVDPFRIVCDRELITPPDIREIASAFFVRLQSRCGCRISAFTPLSVLDVTHLKRVSTTRDNNWPISQLAVQYIGTHMNSSELP